MPGQKLRIRISAPHRIMIKDIKILRASPILGEYLGPKTGATDHPQQGKIE